MAFTVLMLCIHEVITHDKWSCTTCMNGPLSFCYPIKCEAVTLPGSLENVDRQVTVRLLPSGAQEGHSPMRLFSQGVENAETWSRPLTQTSLLPMISSPVSMNLPLCHSTTSETPVFGPLFWHRWDFMFAFAVLLLRFWSAIGTFWTTLVISVFHCWASSILYLQAILKDLRAPLEATGCEQSSNEQLTATVKLSLMQTLVLLSRRGSKFNSLNSYR